MFNEFLKAVFGCLCVLAVMYAVRHAQSDEQTAADAPAVETRPAPAAPPPPAANPVQLIHDDVTYVATGDAYSQGISIYRPAVVQIVLDVDNKAPTDLLVFRGSISSADYVIKGDPQLKILGAIVNAVIPDTGSGQPADKRSEPANPQLVFRKRGVYLHFESDWIDVLPGDYSVVADNTGWVTPSRGDAPVRMRIFVK